MRIGVSEEARRRVLYFVEVHGRYASLDGLVVEAGYTFGGFPSRGLRRSAEVQRPVSSTQRTPNLASSRVSVISQALPETCIARNPFNVKSASQRRPQTREVKAMYSHSIFTPGFGAMHQALRHPYIYL